MTHAPSPATEAATTTARQPVLEVEDLHVAVEGKEILKGVSLTVHAGEVHALMGRNGSGKSTLSAALMGHPRYEVTSGSLRYLGEELGDMPVHERAQRGIFLCFQYPVALPGVLVANFLRQSVRAVRGDQVPVKEFRPLVKRLLADLDISEDFMSRYVNDGFSGGEKKRMEILQMLLLEPRLAVLDETDSGLDIDALKVVAAGINRLRAPHRAQLLITHYQRILDHVTPDRVHVLMDGRVVKSGGPELAHQLEAEGYEWLEGEAGHTGT
jgi:Fe-S cluster assembly ATP-binding protein